MHTIRYGADGTYPRTPCGLKLGEDRFHYCGPRFLTEHCARLDIGPCPVCWPPTAPTVDQLALDLGSVS